MSLRFPTTAEEIAAHNDRLAAQCPVTVLTWKALKGIVYSGFVLAIVALSFYGATRWQLGAVGIVAIVVIFVGEVKEIEIANLVTVTFRNGRNGRAARPRDPKDEE